MLVLTRKQQEKIQIGDSITVTILRVKGQTVRIGIEAPEGVRILRGELTSHAPSEPASNSSTTETNSAAEPPKRRGLSASRQSVTPAQATWPASSPSLLHFRAPGGARVTTS